MILAAAITVGVLFSLIIYILVNGVVHLKPELFAWEYNTSNMSMMPAIISTVYITALSLLMAVPVGIFSAIYLVEYARGQQTGQSYPDDDGNFAGDPVHRVRLVRIYSVRYHPWLELFHAGRIGDAGDHDPAR